MQITEEEFAEQIKLEEEMITTGADRFMRHVTDAHTRDRGADTGYATRLMGEYLPAVAKYLADEIAKTGPGPGYKIHPLLRLIQPEVAALLGLRQLFNTYTKPTKLGTLCVKIGESIEDDIKFSKFRELNPQYFQSIIDDFSRKGSFGYSTRHRVFNRHADKLGVEWEAWTPDERMLVGAKIMDAVLQTTDLCVKEKVWGRKGWVYIIYPSQSALDWIQKFNINSSVLFPERGPCVIPPAPWVLNTRGGYFTEGMQMRTPMVKTRNKLALERLSNPSSTVLTALNALQETAWEINKDVLKVLHEVWTSGQEIGIPRSLPYEIPQCPLPPELESKDMTPAQLAEFKMWKMAATQAHSDNKERIAKCFEVVRCMQMANKYLDKLFWFVYQCDFRGRMYPSSSAISPQGGDFNRALLRFHQGKAITENGVAWFKIHGANTYGIDKVSFQDRIKWVDNHKEVICELGRDPFRVLEFWKNADKPWQFLAWAMEFSKFCEVGPSFVSHLSVGLDGTCNGLQNFSALLRDPVGGKATNLLPGPKPSDIYAEVAKVLSAKVQAQTDPKFDNWKKYLAACNGVFPRSMTKRPVMTMPYGVTMHSCRDYLAMFIATEAADHFVRAQAFNQSTVIVPLLWQSMGEVVKAARLGMDWIQSVANLTAKQGHPLSWWSPAGFPVVQDCRRTTIKQVKTQVSGRLRLALRFEQAEQDVKKQTQAAAPNFVHSLDAAHAMFTIQEAKLSGCTAFHFVHDDFGTHAADIPNLFMTLRETFVYMYNGSSPLQEFRDITELDTGISIPAPPECGTLDLKEVLDSPYFFS